MIVIKLFECYSNCEKEFHITNFELESFLKIPKQYDCCFQRIPNIEVNHNNK